MAISTRFAQATHILARLTADRPNWLTSQTLARSIGTNPAVVRRLLVGLAQAGLVTTRLGKGGGARLAKGPKKITLLDIYQAVEAPGLVPLPRAAPDMGCATGRRIQPVIRRVADAAEAAFCATLAAVSLKQFVRDIAAENAAAESAAKSAA